jgi:hypothetical protein
MPHPRLKVANAFNPIAHTFACAARCKIDGLFGHILDVAKMKTKYAQLILVKKV